jgi:hypothetical protein
MRSLHIQVSPTGLLRLATLAAVYRLFTTRHDRARQQASWFPGSDRNSARLTQLARAEARQYASAMEVVSNEGFSESAARSSQQP